MNREEFELLRQLLTVFRNSIDGMSVEQKRAAVRTLVRKVVWDGAQVHVLLFGADEGELDFNETETPLGDDSK